LEYPKVSDLLDKLDFDKIGFWEFLCDENVAWGSEYTITLIETHALYSFVERYIESDPTDPDNETFLNILHNYMDTHEDEYYVIQ